MKESIIKKQTQITFEDIIKNPELEKKVKRAVNQN